METYRFQQIAYLLVPIILGTEFFLSAREEKKRAPSSVGHYALDTMGFIFASLIPAIFFLTIWAIETKAFPAQSQVLSRFDRYGVLFFFFGAWWQVYMIGALRLWRTLRKVVATRNRDERVKPRHLILFLILGIYISLLILWVSPWGLKWISVIWFIFLFAVMTTARLKPSTCEGILWTLAGLTFFCENILFIWLESVI